MNRNPLALALLLATAAPLAAFAADQLVPAGALVQCTISEPRLSSKTADVGDPVLCRVNQVELSGRSPIPYGSYLAGRFVDYKDPGHLIGKGWMELKFDRLITPPDTVLGFSGKVVDVPKYDIDKQGRIHGRGHAVRDTVEWMIPILWPIDLINLPRRGPRPVLKAETRITIKIMDDLEVSGPQRPQPQQAIIAQPGLLQRAPMSYEQPEQPPLLQNYEQPAAPIIRPMDNPPPQPPRPIPTASAAQPVILLVMTDGYGMYATRYWTDDRGRIRYTAVNGAPVVLPMSRLDLPSTIEANRRRGVEFNLPPAAN